MYKKFISIIKKYIALSKISRAYSYRLEHIDTQSQTVLITFGYRSTTIKSTIKDVVADQHIIENLPQHHTCWLGYYYAKYWHSQRIERGVSCIDHSKTMSKKIYRLEIISVDRNKKIMLLDHLTGEYKHFDAKQLANSKKLSFLSPAHAFHIGFLSAICKLKESHQKNVKLRLVR